MRGALQSPQGPNAGTTTTHNGYFLCTLHDVLDVTPEPQLENRNGAVEVDRDKFYSTSLLSCTSDWNGHSESLLIY